MVTQFNNRGTFAKTGEDFSDEGQRDEEIDDLRRE